MGVIFVIIPRTLFEWFRPEEAGHVIFDEVMKYAWIIMFCVAIDNIFNASRFVFMGALRGAGDTKIPMWLEIACSWGILVPGGYILINVFHLSVVSIWIFIVCYISLLSGVIYLRFRSGAWEKIELIDRNHEDIESQAPLETEIEDYHV
jgi:MATE family multidrug resistance protein